MLALGPLVIVHYCNLTKQMTVEHSLGSFGQNCKYENINKFSLLARKVLFTRTLPANNVVIGGTLPTNNPVQKRKRRSKKLQTSSLISLSLFAHIYHTPTWLQRSMITISWLDLFIICIVLFHSQSVGHCSTGL